MIIISISFRWSPQISFWNKLKISEMSQWEFRFQNIHLHLNILVVLMCILHQYFPGLIPFPKISTSIDKRPQEFELMQMSASIFGIINSRCVVIPKHTPSPSPFHHIWFIEFSNYKTIEFTQLNAYPDLNWNADSLNRQFCATNKAKWSCNCSKFSSGCKASHAV